MPPRDARALALFYARGCVGGAPPPRRVPQRLLAASTLGKYDFKLRPLRYWSLASCFRSFRLTRLPRSLFAASAAAAACMSDALRIACLWRGRWAFAPAIDAISMNYIPKLPRNASLPSRALSRFPPPPEIHVPASRSPSGLRKAAFADESRIWSMSFHCYTRAVILVINKR